MWGHRASDTTEHAHRHLTGGGKHGEERKGGGAREPVKRGKGQDGGCSHPAAGSTAGPSGDIFMGVGLGAGTQTEWSSAVQPRAGKTGHRGCVRRGQREAASGGSAARPLPPVHSTTWISEGPTPRGRDPPTPGHSRASAASRKSRCACYPSEPVRGQASWPRGHSPPMVCPISAWVTHRLREDRTGGHQQGPGDTVLEA